MVVSSVERCVVAPVMALGKSFMNREKSVGPRTEPWGIPEGTARRSDTELATRVDCVRYSRESDWIVRRGEEQVQDRCRGGRYMDKRSNGLL